MRTTFIPPASRQDEGGNFYKMVSQHLSAKAFIADVIGQVMKFRQHYTTSNSTGIQL